MPISYKAETGEAWALSPEGAWAPTKVAKNAQTGETFALDGAEWKLIPPPAPQAPPERSGLERAGRMAGHAAQDFIDRGAELVTAPADLVWAGVEALTGWKPPGGTAAEKLKSAIPDVGPDKAETEGERIAKAAGSGAADALSLVIPGGALARTSRFGPVAQNVGRTLAQQPGAQVIAGATGGAVTEATDNPWLGLGAALVAPGAAGKVAGRVASPVRSSLTPEQARLAAEAQQMGIPLTAAQATGSRPLQALESVFKTLPLTAGAQQKVQQAQQGAFNRAALAHTNEVADELSPAVLGRARQRIGGEIENLAAQTTVVPDAAFTQDLGKTVAEYSRRLDAMRKPVFDNFVSDIQDMMNAGGMPGATYQSTRSTLSSMANNASDPYFAKALRSLRNTLDDAADRAMPAQLKDAWRDARRQWGNLRKLEKAMTNTTTQAASGNLPPTQLSLHVKKQGPMADLADIGTNFVRDPIPNSGTPERMMWQGLLTNPGALMGGTALGMTVDPVAAAATAAGGLLGARGVQGIYNSKPIQAYLSNQRGRAYKPQYNAGLLGAIGVANMPGGDEGIDPRLLGLLGQ